MKIVSWLYWLIYKEQSHHYPYSTMIFKWDPGRYKITSPAQHLYQDFWFGFVSVHLLLLDFSPKPSQFTKSIKSAPELFTIQLTRCNPISLWYATLVKCRCPTTPEKGCKAHAFAWGKSHMPFRAYLVQWFSMAGAGKDFIPRPQRTRASEPVLWPMLWYWWVPYTLCSACWRAANTRCSGATRMSTMMHLVIWSAVFINKKLGSITCIWWRQKSEAKTYLELYSLYRGWTSHLCNGLLLLLLFFKKTTTKHYFLWMRWHKQ